MSKQTERDCMQHIKGNEFYKNVERQNIRMDFLKKLLQTSNIEDNDNSQPDLD